MVERSLRMRDAPGSIPGVSTAILFTVKNNEWACPGVEPGTSRTRSENHTTRPTGRFTHEILFRVNKTSIIRNDLSAYLHPFFQ